MSGDKYIISDKSGCYFVTFTVIHWIDIFSRKERLNYIHDNPVRNGLLDEPWDYVYSSARDYQGRKGLVNIEFA